MALQAKEIKNRLRSIKNTRKITKAMELVSAAKMRRAVASAVETRSYNQAAWSMLARLSQVIALDDEHVLAPFFAEVPENPHTTVVMMTSNRGLAGAFNTNVIREVISQMQENDRERMDFLAMGSKGVQRLNSFGIRPSLAYAKDDTAQNESTIVEMARYLFEAMRDRKTDRVLVIYTAYESALSQKVRVRQLYPISPEAMQEELGESTADSVEFVWEPSSEEILSYLIPRIAQVELFQALLESNASEHSARMLAMKSATDAAGEMADDLTLAFNRARQASITREIAEISAGSAALGS